MIERVGGDSNPHLQQIGCSKRWIFVSPWSIEVDGVLFEFSPGFVYDRSSIPSVVPTWLVSRDSLGTAAPAVHDALYRFRGDVPLDTLIALVSVTPYRTYSRAEADAIFREILLQRGVPRWRAWCAWVAVRAGSVFKKWS